MSLSSKVTKIEELSVLQRERMFELFEAAYDGVDREGFFGDLSWKDEVILLEDDSGELQGFTTLAFNPKGVVHPAGDVLFSGDTIVNSKLQHVTDLAITKKLE